MVKYLLIILIVIQSQFSYGKELETVYSACEKSDINFCKDLMEVKENAEKELINFSKALKIDKSMVVLGVILNQSFKIKSKNHNFDIYLNKVSYSYNF